MAKRKARKDFVPLLHQNLDVKNGLINYARELKRKVGFENQLASAFIYVSISEYLGSNLLENLRYFVHKGTHEYYSGIVFLEENNKTNEKLTLGHLIDRLRKFSFPDKEGIISALEDICESRNNIFHDFAKQDLSNIEKILETDVKIIQAEAEKLLHKINIVYGGLETVLFQNKTESVTDGKSKESDKK